MSALENAAQIRGRHLYVNSPRFRRVPEPCKERKNFLPALQVMNFNLAFFVVDTEGHICYRSVLPAAEQILPLTSVRLLVEGRQEKTRALAGEGLVTHFGALREALQVSTAY